MHAVFHSGCVQSRLPEATQASSACTSLMNPCGKTSGSLIARTVCPSTGSQYGKGVSFPSESTSTSAASYTSMQKRVSPAATRTMLRGQGEAASSPASAAEAASGPAASTSASASVGAPASVTADAGLGGAGARVVVAQATSVKAAMA